MLSWIFIALAHWNNSLWVDMSLYSDKFFWFEPTSLLSFSLMLLALVWPDRGSNQRSIALEASTLTIMPLMPFPTKQTILQDYNVQINRGLPTTNALSTSQIISFIICLIPVIIKKWWVISWSDTEQTQNNRFHMNWPMYI